MGGCGVGSKMLGDGFWWVIGIRECFFGGGFVLGTGDWMLWWEPACLRFYWLGAGLLVWVNVTLLWLLFSYCRYFLWGILAVRRM